MRYVVAIMLVVILGCSKGPQLPEPVNVTGKIQLKGKPASGATVGFSAITAGLPPKYRYQSAVTSEDGSYKLNEVFPAEYLVCVVMPSVGTTTDAGTPDAPVSGTKAPLYSRMTEDNPLRAVVSSDVTNFDFDLK